MSQGIILLGCGGHGKVVLDAALAAGMKIAGIADPALARGSEIFGVAVLGGDEALENDWSGWLNGIGANPSTALRLALFEKYAAQGIPAPAVSHPRAVVSRHADVADGVQIMAGAVIQAGTTIGCNAVINTSASVDHDCKIGPHAFVSPGVTLCGEVILGTGAFVGAGATILPGCVVGADAVVGSGAVVTCDIPPGGKVAGSPARNISRNG